jgi:chromosome segregation ATPase
MSFPVGLLAGIGASVVMAAWLYRRVGVQHGAEIERYRRAIDDMRQERAGDREVNRQLRHELAINTPVNLREERDRALLELDKLNSELLETTLELEDRDRSLREARQAIYEIRVQLERNRDGASETGKGKGEPKVESDPGADPEPGIGPESVGPDPEWDIHHELIDRELLESDDREATTP